VLPLLALQKNHLSGLKRKLLKVSFYNMQQLMEVRREITPTVNKNSKRSTMADAVAALAQQDAGTSGRPRVSHLAGAGCGAWTNSHASPQKSSMRVLPACNPSRWLCLMKASGGKLSAARKLAESDV
jgi:hypothetical protein